jgi:hypothetical protein
MKLVVRLLTEGLTLKMKPKLAPQQVERDLSKLVNLRTVQKPISDARTATYVILSIGSNPFAPTNSKTLPLVGLRYLSCLSHHFRCFSHRFVLWTNADQLKAKADSFSPFLPTLRRL